MSDTNTTKQAIPSDNVAEELTLDEKCLQLMEYVVEMRKTIPKNLKKVNDLIFKIEKRLLEKQAKNTINSLTRTPQTISLSDEKLTNSVLEQHIENKSMYSKLDERLDKISQITRQIQNDEIHMIQRAPFDTQTILSRAKIQASKT